jgi:hypothetical protein
MAREQQAIGDQILETTQLPKHPFNHRLSEDRSEGWQIKESED